MQKSYTSNYIKFYLWQILGISMGFLSMLIVVPRLTGIPALYGIYSLCISFSFFLSYADLGFLAAGYKYASESVARGDRNEEVRIIGFISCILICIVILYSLGILFLAAYPSLVIKDLASPQELRTASNLFLILAVAAPFTALQRSLQLIFGIRLEDYVFQKISILASALRIASVYYFFSASRYDITGFFLFSQSIILPVIIASAVIIRRRYQFDFMLLLRSFRFSKEIYRKTKNLAFSSLYSTIAWILLYEIDLIVISKLLGPSMTAYYAVCLTLLTIIRTLCSNLYGPFYARFNHFMGLCDFTGLKSFFFQVITLTMPLIIFPIVSVAILMKPFMYSWVGSAYIASIPLARILILSFLFSFISNPGNLLIIAQERVRPLNMISTITLIVYWGGILSTVALGGLYSFALFKLIAFAISGIFYFIVAARFLELRPRQFAKRIFIPIVIPLAVTILLLSVLAPLMPLAKSKGHLLLVIGTGVGATSAGIFFYSLFCEDFRRYSKNLLSHLCGKFAHVPC